ncbi:Ovoinhibitor [Pseudolycoriella hygida]|uniref:Ovoinhibitor n=1 Tax=Pseudolycoriella hygida TaxID=35572 RepID=A0A9Q0MYK3_9DIPT|nr:Ovoinhibitor [Pseudolycoriella hygida]
MRVDTKVDTKATKKDNDSKNNDNKGKAAVEIVQNIDHKLRGEDNDRKDKDGKVSDSKVNDGKGNDRKDDQSCNGKNEKDEKIDTKVTKKDNDSKDSDKKDKDDKGNNRKDSDNKGKASGEVGQTIDHKPCGEDKDGKGNDRKDNQPSNGKNEKDEKIDTKNEKDEKIDTKVTKKENDSKDSDRKDKDDKGNNRKDSDNKGKASEEVGQTIDHKPCGEDKDGKASGEEGQTIDHKPCGEDNDRKDKDGKGNDRKDNDGKGNDRKDNQPCNGKNEKDEKIDTKVTKKDNDSKENDRKDKDNKGNNRKDNDNKGKASGEVGQTIDHKTCGENNDRKDKYGKGNDHKNNQPCNGKNDKDEKSVNKVTKKDHEGKDNDRKDNDSKDQDRKDKDRKDNDRKDNDRKDNDRKGNDRKDNDRKDNDRKDNDSKGKNCGEEGHNIDNKPCGQPVCNEFCPLNLDPLCAEPDGFKGDPKTFDNKCLFNLYNCKHPNQKYKAIYDGLCKPKCPEVCPLYEKPFCALPVGKCGKPTSFGNPCLLGVYNCKNPNDQYEYFHDGECIEQPSKPDCGVIDCPQIEKLICATAVGFAEQPRTFLNKCLLEVHNCFNPDKQFQYSYDGKCVTEEPLPECEVTKCPQDNKPVCGLPNGFCAEPRSFPNKCYLDVYNAANPKQQYQYFHDGDCLTKTNPEHGCDVKVCPNENSPVCAVPDGCGGSSRTFTNKCYLEIYNSFNPNARYKYSHDGKCSDEPAPNCDSILCTKERFPVCAIPDNFCGPIREFPNDCERDVYNCKNPTKKYGYFHNGECLKPTKEPLPECEVTKCPQDNKPVCGLPNGFCAEPRSFPNKCYLDVYNAANPKQQYQHFHDGDCLTKTNPEHGCDVKVCPNENSPVCAVPDGCGGSSRTFTNKCYLEIYNSFNPNARYKYSHDGKCSDEPAPNCDSILCTKERFPVCAIPDNFCGPIREFPNDCERDVYNCKNPTKKYGYFHNGECLKSTEPNCAAISCSNQGPAICALPDGFCGEPKTFTNECNLKVYNCINSKQSKYTSCTSSPIVRKCLTTTFLLSSLEYKFFHGGKCLPQPVICNTICPDIYDPVCTIGQSGDVRQFPNKCSFNSYNCQNENKQYMFLYGGECNVCKSIVCNKIYQPICAVNSKKVYRTFSTLCLLQQHNCDNCNDSYEYYSEGECKEPVVCEEGQVLDDDGTYNKCQLSCPKNYDPICGRNAQGGSKTFSNRCEFEKHNCLNPIHQYCVEYEGECNNCRVICQKIFAPLCAIDASGNQKEFANDCEYQSFKCRYSKNPYTKTYDGPCRTQEPVCEVPQPCTMEYAPVCATSATLGSRTFSNKCERDAYIKQHPKEGYVPDYDGVCKEKCQLACPKNLDPLCGINANGEEKTFSNRCEFEKHNCLNPENQYSEGYEGKCNNCRIGCPKIYAPVCTIDGSGVEHQFGNDCEFQSYNCRNQGNQYTLAYEGECHQCQIMCMAIYKPVCAEDFAGNEITYSNQCAFDSYNCRYPYSKHTLKHQGPCKANCLKPCPRIIDPVCAKNEKGNTKTFNTECELENYNCENDNEKYTLQYKGKCKPECPSICLAIYKPVCASPDGNINNNDAQTFSSQCQLDVYNCNNPAKVYTKAADGECPVNCRKLKCPKEEKWICATPINPKGKPCSFFNDCERLLHNCNNPQETFNYSHDGQCDKRF